MDAMKCPTCGREPTHPIEEFVGWCMRCVVRKKFFAGKLAPETQKAMAKEWDLAKIAARFHDGIREDAIWLAQVRA
jgi:hypothetical protein